MANLMLGEFEFRKHGQDLEYRRIGQNQWNAFRRRYVKMTIWQAFKADCENVTDLMIQEWSKREQTNAPTTEICESKLLGKRAVLFSNGAVQIDGTVYTKSAKLLSFLMTEVTKQKKKSSRNSSFWDSLENQESEQILEENLPPQESLTEVENVSSFRLKKNKLLILEAKDGKVMKQDPKSSKLMQFKQVLDPSEFESLAEYDRFVEFMMKTKAIPQVSENIKQLAHQTKYGIDRTTCQPVLQENDIWSPFVQPVKPTLVKKDKEHADEIIQELIDGQRECERIASSSSIKPSDVQEIKVFGSYSVKEDEKDVTLELKSQHLYGLDEASCQIVVFVDGQWKTLPEEGLPEKEPHKMTPQKVQIEIAKALDRIQDACKRTHNSAKPENYSHPPFHAQDVEFQDEFLNRWHFIGPEGFLEHVSSTGERWWKLMTKIPANVMKLNGGVKQIIKKQTYFLDRNNQYYIRTSSKTWIPTENPIRNLNVCMQKYVGKDDQLYGLSVDGEWYENEEKNSDFKDRWKRIGTLPNEALKAEAAATQPHKCIAPKLNAQVIINGERLFVLYNDALNQIFEYSAQPTTSMRWGKIRNASDNEFLLQHVSEQRSKPEVVREEGEVSRSPLADLLDILKTKSNLTFDDVKKAFRTEIDFRSIVPGPEFRLPRDDYEKLVHLLETRKIDTAQLIPFTKQYNAEVNEKREVRFEDFLKSLESLPDNPSQEQVMEKIATERYRLQNLLPSPTERLGLLGLFESKGVTLSKNNLIKALLSPTVEKFLEEHPNESSFEEKEKLVNDLAPKVSSSSSISFGMSAPSAPTTLLQVRRRK
jgi:hypothetical protein